jgi:hypothetical protein
MLTGCPGGQTCADMNCELLLEPAERKVIDSVVDSVSRSPQNPDISPGLNDRLLNVWDTFGAVFGPGPAGLQGWGQKGEGLSAGVAVRAIPGLFPRLCDTGLTGLNRRWTVAGSRN